MDEINFRLGIAEMQRINLKAAIEIIPNEAHREKIIKKKKQSLSQLCDNLKQQNACLIGVSRERIKGTRRKKILEETMAEKLPNC